MEVGDSSEHNFAVINIAEVFSAGILPVSGTFQIFQHQDVVLSVELAEVAFWHRGLQARAGVALLVEDHHAPNDLRINLSRNIDLI